MVSNTSYENKKLAVDLAELVIKWEVQRVKEKETLKGDSMSFLSPSIFIYANISVAATPMAIDTPKEEAGTPSNEVYEYLCLHCFIQ